MRIRVLDTGGNFIGTAIGLVRAGHDVVYSTGADVRPIPLAAVGGSDPEPRVDDADLVVVAASFGDERRTAERREFGDAPVDPLQPLFSTLNPEQARIRNDWLAARLPRANLSVVVDMSDDAMRVDPAFASFGDVRLKREWRPEHVVDGIGAFPFLYHVLVLEAELCGELDGFRKMPHDRRDEPALRFAGVVDHDRYAGRRRRWLREVATLHPDLRVEVVGPNLPAVSTWGPLQDARAGIYLAGTGALCFRLHEYAALGVPILAHGFEPIGLPPAWREVLAASVQTLATPERMLEFYFEHYAPLRSAEWLLSRCEGSVRRGRRACTAVPRERREHSRGPTVMR